MFQHDSTCLFNQTETGPDLELVGLVKQELVLCIANKGCGHYTTLHYTTLHGITLQYSILYNTTINYTTVYYTTFYSTSLHFTTLDNH